MVRRRWPHAVQSDGGAPATAPRLSKSEKLAQEGSGLRALSDDEIKALWTATATPTPFHNLVRLALCTGLRKGEAARLRWSDIDFKAGKITVPGHYTKTAMPHEVALTPLSRLILSQTPKRAGPLLFPSNRVAGGATPLSGWTQLVRKSSPRLPASLTSRHTL